MDGAEEIFRRRVGRDLAEDGAGTLRQGRRNFYLRKLRALVGVHPALSQPVLRLWLRLRRASDANPLRAAPTPRSKVRAALLGSAALWSHQGCRGTPRAIRPGRTERGLLEG